MAGRLCYLPNVDACLYLTICGKYLELLGIHLRKEHRMSLDIISKNKDTPKNFTEAVTSGVMT